jgi:sugar phosphate isomerase/epimerase
MKLAFMTSVLPKATLTELIDSGKKHGYQGIEFRPEWSHAHGAELSATPEQRKAIRRQMADSGLEGCCISPSATFNESERAKRDERLEQLCRYIELARELGVGRIRMFCDPLPNTGAGARSNLLQAQAEYMVKGAEKAAQAGVRLVLETHGTGRAVDVDEILWRAAYPAALWVNWHLAHCLNHGEDVDEAYRHIKGRVDHVHFSLREDKHETFEYLLRQAELLSDEGYEGFFAVEDINPPDGQVSLQIHADGWKRVLQKLGR